MKKFLILFKRMCMKPLNLIILLILPVIAITFRMLPEKSVKSSITTGIYIEQDDQWLDSFKKLMSRPSDSRETIKSIPYSRMNITYKPDVMAIIWLTEHFTPPIPWDFNFMIYARLLFLINEIYIIPRRDSSISMPDAR